MPSTIVQGLLEIVFRLLAEVVGYFVGRVVVSVVSLGRWRCDRLDKDVPRRKLRASGSYHRESGQMYVTVEATCVVGQITEALLVGAGVLLWRFSKS